MYSYLIGKVISINKRTITFENNYTGYFINVNKPKKFEINKVKKLYIYKHMTSNNKNNLIEELYGFENYETKELFLNLISISGIGPKTAINICNNDINIIKSLIISRDAQGLSVLEGITPKYARLIVDNLCDAFTQDSNQSGSIEITKLVNALKTLGYGAKEIDFAIRRLDVSKDLELSDLISQAIKIIARGEDEANIIKTN